MSGNGLFDELASPDDCGPYRATLPAQAHSPTSRAAAELAADGAETRRRAVLEYLRQCGEAGAIDEQIIDHFGGPAFANGIRPRRVELMQMGLVKDSGRTRRTEKGREAVVWVINTSTNGVVIDG